MAGWPTPSCSRSSPRKVWGRWCCREPPAMSAGQRTAADAVLMPTYRRYPVTFVRGKGFYLYDETGRPYLDFVAGVAVTGLGHAHPEVTEAVSRQAGRPGHTPNPYYPEPVGGAPGPPGPPAGRAGGRGLF